MNSSEIGIRNIVNANKPLESFKSLRTNLLYIDDLKVISITSTTPDEGKTVSAFHLANAFAEMGKKVVLLDCDLRRTSLNDLLMINKSLKGLSEVLTKQSDTLVYKTNINNLFIVPSGKKPPNPSELLSSPHFKDIIDQLRKEFDYVIVDTPPVTAAMDAAIVGRYSDGVLMVVRNEFTKKKMLKRAVVELERNGSRIVGVVLNRVKKNQVDYSSYDKYYY